MKKVIKHPKKMKNAMYIVFGVFALALFAITRIHPSYASEGLMIDDALDAIVLYGEVEQLPEDDEEVEEVQDEEIEQIQEVEDEDIVKPEETSEDLDETVLERDDKIIKVNVDELGENEEQIDETKQILEEVLQNSFEEYSFSNDISEVIKPNDEIDLSFTLGDYSTYPRIIWNQLSGLITIYTGDFSYGITIQDRNLGAETISDIGNYYKFGINTIITTGNSSTISSNNNTNAWGGGQDLDTSNPTIVRGYDTVNHVSTNLLNRRGPCGEGYHVPSAGEINELLRLYYDAKGMGTSMGSFNGGAQIYDYNYSINKDLKIVPSGVIAYGSKFDSSYYYFQSSSYKDTKWNSRYHYYQINYDVNANGASRDIDYAMPVRCFKNNFVPINEYTPHTRTVIYHPNGGSFPGMEVNEVIEKTYEYGGLEYSQIYNIQIPNRNVAEGDMYSGWMFVGWYTKQGNINDPLNSDWGEEFDINTSTTSIAYAKWLPFNDLEILMGDLKFTIMDRNLGAEDVAEGIYSSSSPEDASKLGCYYQWGNNYGHCNSQDLYPKSTTAGTISNVEHETSPRGPNNYYYSNKYVLRNNTYRWETEQNFNLRGGEDVSTPDNSKKGPCPAGYHIPNETEWKFIYNKINSVKQQDANYCIGEYSDIGLCLAKKLKAPYAGLRDSSLDGKLNWVGSDARYWSSSSNTSSFAFNLLWRDTNIYTSNYTYHTDAIPIRCFKNDGKEIVFNTNGGNEITETFITKRRREGESDIKLLPTKEEIKKEDYTFDGRYTTSGFEEGTKVINNNINIEKTKVILYAKRKENPNIILKANGGKFENGEEEKVIKANEIFKKRLINDTYSNTIIRKIAVFTGAESIHLSGTGSPTCLHKINIYNFDKTGNNEGSVYKVIESKYNNGYYFEINEDIPGDIVTIEVETGSCNATPKFDIIATSNGINYYEITDEIPNIQRNGYEFQGWYEENSNSKYNIEETPIAEDKTFYAKWDANTYTVSFNADNGEVNPGNITVTYDSQYPGLPVLNKTGYTFSGWYNGEEMVSSGDIVKITEDVILKAKRKMNQYKIIFDTDGGNEISPIEKDYNSVINITLPTPTKECNEFSGWDTELPERMPAHDITLKAIWEYTCSRSSGGGGGAKKSESTTREIAIDTPTDQEHNSANEEQKTETNETSNTPTNGETSNQVISVTQEISEDGTPIEVVVQTVTIKNTDIVATVRTEIPSSNATRSNSSSKTHTKEENDAYSFAKSNGITTTDSIETAKMNTELTRIQMAKMLSNFAINVLGQEPDPEKGIVKFDDVTNKMDKQYDNAVTKAYQLGIMGQNVKNNEFRPNDTVTRAEFASALSRLLYHTEEGNYKGTGKYYVPHVAKLYNEGIINKADPKIKEKRGYVMTMLKRTVE